MSFKLPDRDRDARVLQAYVQERVNPILEGMVTQVRRAPRGQRAPLESIVRGAFF